MARYRFRVLYGTYVGHDDTRPTKEVTGRNGKPALADLGEAGAYDRSSEGNLGRLYKARGVLGHKPGDDIIDTDLNLLNLNKPGVTPKFALADELQSAETTWNPKTETLEQFNERMREMLKKKAEAAVPGAGEVLAAAAPPQPTKAPPPGGYPDPDSLDRLSLQELKDLAATEEIHLGSAKTKDQILQVLKQALVPAS